VVPPQAVSEGNDAAPAKSARASAKSVAPEAGPRQGELAETGGCVGVGIAAKVPEVPREGNVARAVQRSRR
jgi:hypothetical protein